MPQNTRPTPSNAGTVADTAQELQAISIRLPKRLIEAYKMVAAHHGVGYQPLMRDALQRAVPDLLQTAE